MASGEGETSPEVPLQGRTSPRTLQPGEVARVWVAFRQRQMLPEPTLPRHLVLRIPVEGEAVLALVLAEPFTARPRWQVVSRGYAARGA